VAKRKRRKPPTRLYRLKVWLRSHPEKALDLATKLIAGLTALHKLVEVLLTHKAL
jgi:hypothetical protein